MPQFLITNKHTNRSKLNPLGKTRFGQELNSTLRQYLPEKVREKGLNYSPCHYYMLLDFIKSAMLRQFEAGLDAEIILGLRLAYHHFFQGKYYAFYSDFAYRVLDHREIFTISNVFLAIRKDLKVPAEKPLFIFLHIDEFQEIFDHQWEGTPKRRHPSLPTTGVHLAGDKAEGHTREGLSLFKDMMRSLGDFMSGAMNPSMIQTFLSGTARQEVTLAAEPTLCTFEFLDCPPLSLGACYDIMDSFMTQHVAHCEWMPKKGFLYLLSATGGLPRALQLLLEQFFGSRLEECIEFLKTLPDIDQNTRSIFESVGERLDLMYSITSFAVEHKDLVSALVRLCILQQSVERQLAPSVHFPQLTLDVLERDAHTILQKSDDNDGKVLVQIPFFFLYRYNKVVEQVRNQLNKIFVEDWEASRGWDFFESVVAEYEALRTNLLLYDRKAATLGDIYRGAMGRPETLGRIVKLKELSFVTLKHIFPESGRPTTDDAQELNWRSSKVLINATGASFADVCVCRECSDGNDGKGAKILCGLQTRKSIVLKTIEDEQKKNLLAIKNVPAGSLLVHDDIKNTEVITILVTTADVSDDTFKTLNESFPDNCLLIYQGNFTKFFGDSFGVSAALAVSEGLSWNFATEETLRKKCQLGKREISEVLDNMPYRSYEDLLEKVPALGNKVLDDNMGFLPYQNSRPEKRRRVM